MYWLGVVDNSRHILLFKSLLITFSLLPALHQYGKLGPSTFAAFRDISQSQRPCISKPARVGQSRLLAFFNLFRENVHLGQKYGRLHGIQAAVYSEPGIVVLMP